MAAPSGIVNVLTSNTDLLIIDIFYHDHKQKGIIQSNLAAGTRSMLSVVFTPLSHSPGLSPVSPHPTDSGLLVKV